MSAKSHKTNKYTIFLWYLNVLFQKPLLPMLLRSLYVAFLVISLHSSTTCPGPGNSLLGETGCKRNQQKSTHEYSRFVCPDTGE